jgi:hypothetical protein
MTEYQEKDRWLEYGTETLVEYLKQEVSYNFSEFRGKDFSDRSLLGSDT